MGSKVPDADALERLRKRLHEGDPTLRERIQLGAYLGDAAAVSATGTRPSRRRGVRAWIDAAPGANPPEPKSEPPRVATDPRAPRIKYLQRLSSETSGVNSELTEQIEAAIADPTTQALSNLAQRISTKAVSEKFPRAIEAMTELIALTSDTMETCVFPTAPLVRLSEVQQRAGIAAVRSLLGTPKPDLTQRVARDLAALHEAPHEVALWLRDLEPDVEAELRLTAAESLLLGNTQSLIVDAFSEVKDRSDAGPRGWRGAAAIHAALSSSWDSSEELDEALRLATRALKASSVKEAISAELIPWALGESDPVADRVRAAATSAAP
jgi:hypothetical protein